MNFLSLLVTCYGVAGALSSLLQVRRMLATRSSRDLSVAFLLIYAGGYLIWLTYGLATGSVPLIIVDAIGLLVAGVTLSIALNLRLRENGQSFREALREERETSIPHLRWLAPQVGKRAVKPPAGLQHVQFNRLYPLPVALSPAQPPPPNVSLAASSDVEQTEQRNHFWQNAVMWRQFDNAAGAERNELLTRWRAHLSASLDLLPPEWRREAAVTAAARELTRSPTSAPIAGRLGACRTVTLAASLHTLPVSDNGAWPQVAELLDHQLRCVAGQMTAGEQHWTEQLLGAFLFAHQPQLHSLTAEQNTTVSGTVTSLQLPVPPVVPVLLAPDNWAWLLWPAANTTVTGMTPDPLACVPVQAHWFTDDTPTLMRALALTARPRDPSRLVDMRPLDRSLTEGLASAMVVASRRHSPQELAALYPLERGAVVACLGDMPVSEAAALFAEVDVADSAGQLARLAGLPREHLLSVYEKQYRKIAKLALAEPPTDWTEFSLHEQRIKLLWREALSL